MNFMFYFSFFVLAVFCITFMKKTNKHIRLSVACVFQKKSYSGGLC